MTQSHSVRIKEARFKSKTKTVKAVCKLVGTPRGSLPTRIKLKHDVFQRFVLTVSKPTGMKIRPYKYRGTYREVLSAVKDNENPWIVEAVEKAKRVADSYSYCDGEEAG